MNAFPLLCTRCRTPLIPEMAESPHFTACAGCRSWIRVEVFPSLFREPGEDSATPIAIQDGQAACFYHPSKQAMIACDTCGRFLCGLCDIDFDGRHICPACLETGRKKRRHPALEMQRTRYDMLALYLTLVPLLLVFTWFAVVVTAPMALFLCIRHRNAPGSLVHRTRPWWAVAFLLSILEIAGFWGWFIWMLAR